MVKNINFTKQMLSILLMPSLIAACSPALPANNQTDDNNISIFLDTTPSVTPLPVSATSTLRSPTITPSDTQTPSVTATLLSDGCREPGDNYERLTINGHRLNARTVDMLTYAQSIYGGVIDITGDAITQGSYTDAVEASFGTHAGGGAVDISVMKPATYEILFEDIEPLIMALRLAGFAAWYRDFGELYPGSPVHIHAIAIGDQELSWAARSQLDSPFGYFWGYNGLPGNMPVRDSHGGPILCDWMRDLGYPEQTATPMNTD